MKAPASILRDWHLRTLKSEGSTSPSDRQSSPCLPPPIVTQSVFRTLIGLILVVGTIVTLRSDGVLISASGLHWHELKDRLLLLPSCIVCKTSFWSRSRSPGVSTLGCEDSRPCPSSFAIKRGVNSSGREAECGRPRISTRTSARVLAK